MIGRPLVRALLARGDEVVVLARSASRASTALGTPAVEWDPSSSTPAPADALAGADAVVNLMGEPVAQRWNDAVKRRIRASRVDGTALLVAGISALPEESRPKALVSSSAAGIYGDGGAAELDESAPPGDDFLALICVGWEEAAAVATGLGLRVCSVRTGVVLHRSGGALKTMLLPFRLGLGGRVGGGKQYMPWIHLDDIVGIYLAALDNEAWDGPVNGAAPGAVTNLAFTRALGRALRRPTAMPVPQFALKLIYGEMAQVLVEGQRMVPKRALELGYQFRHEAIDDALRAALQKGMQPALKA
jgi:uncharacterized protein (TIGR01777 family)